MSIKRVNSKYWNKSIKGYVYKTYIYEETKDPTTGRKVRKQIKAITKETISTSPKIVRPDKTVDQKALNNILSSTDDLAVKAEIKALVKEAVRKGRELTRKTLYSSITTNKIERFLVNAGYTSDEAIEALGISEEELFDPNNWQGSTFTAGGRTYDVVFRYSGDVFVLRK